MDDLIKRSDAIKALDNAWINGASLLDANEAVKQLKDLPPADRPQVEWIGEADGYADGELVYDTWYCSNCDYVVDDDEPPTWNYCPNCGCYNGGGQSEND